MCFDCFLRKELAEYEVFELHLGVDFNTVLDGFQAEGVITTHLYYNEEFDRIGKVEGEVAYVEYMRYFGDFSVGILFCPALQEYIAVNLYIHEYDDKCDEGVRLRQAYVCRW